MSEREQWRFQWPDGTWIRWNPATQSWEKEEGQGEPVRATSTRTETAPRPEAPVPAEPVVTPARPVPPPATTPTPTPAEATRSTSGWKSLGDAVDEKSAPTPAVAPETTEQEPVSAVDEEPGVKLGSIQEPPPRAPRLGVSDVIPPREPERPGGSLWPTIVAGAAVGIAVGILLSSVVR